LRRRELQSRLILQVHDELVFEVRDSEVEPMKQLVQDKMENVAVLRVPLKVEIAVGSSWYDAK
jgi:DNA polymerase-1